MDDVTAAAIADANAVVAKLIASAPPVLYLDLDGVCNDHTKLPNGICGLQFDKIVHLNTIIDAVPDVRIVISSAWRYIVSKGAMTANGFRYLLMTHGLKVPPRALLFTDVDETVWGEGLSMDEMRARGMWCRGECIRRHALANGFTRYVAIDDMEIEIPQLIKTDGAVGLTAEIAQQVIAALRSC